MKDLNRIKVVLVEKREQTSGWQSSLAKTLLPYPNGVPIHRNPIWQLCSK